MDPQHSTPMLLRSNGFLKKKTERGSQLLTPDPSPVPVDPDRQVRRATASQKAASQLPTPDPSPPMGRVADQSDLQACGLNRHPAAADANPALTDYTMQLMLLEQQNKKRLLMSQQAQLQQQQQQAQLSLQQNKESQAQQNFPGRQLNGQQQMSAQDNALVIVLTNKLLSQASEEEKNTTRASLQSRMDPQQLQKYQAQGLDPLYLYYRSQALHRLRQEKQTRLAQAQAQLQQQQQQAQLQAKAAMTGLSGSGVKTADMGSGFLPTPPRSARNSPLNFQANATPPAVQQQAPQHTFAPQQAVQQPHQRLVQEQQMAQQRAFMSQIALHPALQQQQSIPPPPRNIYHAYLQNRNQQFFGITAPIPQMGQNSLQPNQLSSVQIPAHQIKAQFPQATQEQVTSMISDPVARSIYQEQLSNLALYPLEDLDEYEPLFPEDKEKTANSVLQPRHLPGMLPISLPLSPKPESPRVETVHNAQFDIVDIEDASRNKSPNHSSIHDEIAVHSDPEGATARLSQEGTTISISHPQDQSQPHLSLDHEHGKVESSPKPPNDQLTRNNSLTSFTEDDTDWGEEEETTSYDLFADFSAVSEGAGDEFKAGLTRPVFSPMKQGIVDRLMKEFWSLWDGEGGIFRNSTIVSPVAVSVDLNDNSNDNAVKTHEGGEGSSGDKNSGPIANTASQNQRSTNSNLKRRGREDEDEREQNTGDDRNPKRPRKSPSPPKTPEKSTRFACPYRKRDPRKYCVRHWRPCALTPLDNVARVKGHLYRHHRIFPCRRCKELFKDQAAVNSHLEQSEGCELRAVEIADGVTADIVDKLRNKKTGQRTEAQRWEDIYRLLFPNELIPSPYFEDIQEDLALSPDSRDLADYEEYCRRELPLLFRAALEERIQNESQPIEENIRNQLMDIIRDCQDRVSSRYRSSTMTAAGTPSRNPTSSRSPTIGLESRTNLSMTANATPQPSIGDISPFFQPPPPQSHLQSRLEVSDLQDSASKLPDSSDPSDSGYGSNESGISSGISSAFNNSSDDLSLPSSQPHIPSRPFPSDGQGSWGVDNELPNMSSGNDLMYLAETSEFDVTFDSSFDSSWEYDYQSTYGDTWDPDMSMGNPFPSDGAF